jgi:hypothetical protein
VRAGKVPKKIVAIAVKQQAKEPITAGEALTLIEYLIAASFVAPEVTFARKAGALCVSDLSDEDKAAVIDLLKLV